MFNVFLIRFETDAVNSRVIEVQVKPAGEHTKFTIKTFNRLGEAKTFGGDAIRVTLRGKTTVAANVFDKNDGEYDVVALLMQSGKYLVDIHLDYTLCKGLKDPPMEWFVNGEFI